MIKDVLGTYHEPRMFRSLFCGGTFSASKWKKTKSLCVPQKEWTTFPVKAMKKKKKTPTEDELKPSTIIQQMTTMDKGISEKFTLM